MNSVKQFTEDELWPSNGPAPARSSRSAKPRLASRLCSGSLRDPPIHAPKSVGHHFHDLGGEIRRPLDKGMKLLLVQGYQSAFAGRDDRRCAWRCIDEGQFAEKRARPRLLDHLVADQNFRRSSDQNVHCLAGIAFQEKRLAALKADDLRCLGEENVRIHSRRVSDRNPPGILERGFRRANATRTDRGTR